MIFWGRGGRCGLGWGISEWWVGVILPKIGGAYLVGGMVSEIEMLLPWMIFFLKVRLSPA